MTTVPLWVIFLGPAAVTIIVVVCAWLMLQRLNYYTSVLLKNAVDATEDRKSVAIETASTLADKQAAVANTLSKKVEVTAEVLSKKVEATAATLASSTEGLSKKVDATADALSKKVDATATTLAGRVEETALQILAEIQQDLKLIHKRIHKLEGTNKEDEVLEALDRTEQKLNLPITEKVAAALNKEPEEKKTDG